MTPPALLGMEPVLVAATSAVGAGPGATAAASADGWARAAGAFGESSFSILVSADGLASVLSVVAAAGFAVIPTSVVVVTVTPVLEAAVPVVPRAATRDRLLGGPFLLVLLLFRRRRRRRRCLLTSTSVGRLVLATTAGIPLGLPLPGGRSPGGILRHEGLGGLDGAVGVGGDDRPFGVDVEPDAPVGGVDHALLGAGFGPVHVAAALGLDEAGAGGLELILDGLGHGLALEEVVALEVADGLVHEANGSGVVHGGHGPVAEGQVLAVDAPQTHLPYREGPADGPAAGRTAGGYVGGLGLEGFDLGAGQAQLGAEVDLVLAGRVEDGAVVPVGGAGGTRGEGGGARRNSAGSARFFLRLLLLTLHGHGGDDGSFETRWAVLLGASG